MSLASDLRFASRVLLKNRGFTIIAVITLALGIAANTIVFSVVNAVLLRPLPYEKSERLVRIYGNSPDRRFPRFGLSYPDFADWKEQNQSMDDMAAWFNSSANLSGTGEPERLGIVYATSNLFALLGAKPYLGRLFLAEDAQPQSDLVVVLSHGTWQRRFGSDPGILGRSLTLDGSPYTVAGVLPPEFRLYGQEADLWTAMRISTLPENLRSRGNHIFAAMGRLKTGVSVRQAQLDLESIAGRLEQMYAKSNTGWSVNVFSMYSEVTRDIRQVLAIIFVASLLVLLIACVNVASLQLTRMSARSAEMAIRTALGARRGHLIKQLLTESVLLSVVGALFGLALAKWGLDLLIKLTPAGKVPRLNEVTLDASVFLFTAFITVVVGGFFGLFMASKRSTLDLGASLKEGGRGIKGDGGGRRIRRFLVVSEVALALVLIICAGLVLQSFYRLLGTDPGFKAENVVTMQVTLTGAGYRDSQGVANFYRQVLDRIRSLPEVSSAAASNILPLKSGGILTPIILEENLMAGNTQGTTTAVDTVTPDYFRTMGTLLIRGRDFKEEEESPVVLVNQAAAKSFWPDEDAIGKRVRFSTSDTTGSMVIGVVGDVRSAALEADPKPHLYVAFNDSTNRTATLIVRANAASAGIVPTLKSTVWSLDSNLPLYSIRTLTDVVSDSVAPQKMSTVLLVVFASVALILAAVGIYGVMSYSVAQRTHEIGVRMALGAKPYDILKLVLGEGMFLTGAGVVIGVVGSLVVSPVLSGLLYGIRAIDVTTFIAVSALFSVVALVACYLPTRRAMRVVPMNAIRYE